MKFEKRFLLRALFGLLLLITVVAIILINDVKQAKEYKEWQQDSILFADEAYYDEKTDAWYYYVPGDRDSEPLGNSLIRDSGSIVGTGNTEYITSFSSLITYAYGVFITTYAEELDKFKEGTKASPYWDFCIKIDSVEYKFNREDLKLLTNK